MNFVFDKATDNDKQDLIKVWQTAFGDSKEYIDFFYNENKNNVTILVGRIQNKVVGAIHLFETTLLNKRKKSFYIYACAVLPEYRGNGFTKQILNKVFEYCNKNDYGLVLKPANEKLAKFYETLGFKKNLYLEYKTSFNESDFEFELKQIQSEEYKQIRDKTFNINGYFEWNIDYINFCINENRFCGGFVYKIISDKSYIVLGNVVDKNLQITETTIPINEFDKYVFKLKKHFNCKTVSALLYNNNKGNFLSGMTYNIESLQEGYINLLLM